MERDRKWRAAFREGLSVVVKTSGVERRLPPRVADTVFRQVDSMPSMSTIIEVADATGKPVWQVVGMCESYANVLTKEDGREG